MADIAQQLHKLEQRIQKAAQLAGRPRQDILLLAVSKTRPLKDLIAAWDAGLTAFAESYVQEAIEKIQGFAQQRPDAKLEWHFIGPIQSNKTRDIAHYFDWVHSIDRLKIAQRLNEQRRSDTPLNVCVQVNTSGELSKAGVRETQAAELLEQIRDLPNLRLRGLMTIPAPAQDLEQQRQPLHRLRCLLEQFNTAGAQLDTLSMGMSNDLEAAILEGATIVRIGTDLFGRRT